MRLIEPVDESDRYAALSYCWGKGNSFTLTTKNLSQLKTGVKPCSLPKTLRDAVQITQRLGLRYLWIDALCIAQDDRDDWAEQSAQMADIYGQAHITLAAQDTADVDEGCIFPLPVKFNDQVVLFPEASNEAVTCFITDAKDFMPRNLSLTVLNSRGWTFQERVLSRRVLFLRKTEIMFECNDMFVTQHGHQDAEKATISLNTAEPATDPGVSTVSSQTKAWNALVKEYSGRALSHMTDRLPALAGVASQFSKGTGADYIAGSWSNTVIENMLFAWAGGGDFGPEEEFYKTYTTPSWSWAAHYGRQGLVYEHIGDRIAEIIDMQASLSTGNPFGAISDSWLAVRAPLLSLSQTPNPDRPDASTGKPMCFKVAVDYPILVQDARVDLRFHWRTNPSANHLTVKLFALVLCWRDNVSAVRGQNDISSTDQIVSGIIVTPAGPQRAEMHRVGMLNLWGTGLRIWDRLTDSTTFSTVVLV